MAFVKVVKNKAYFKRYQVKYRRRREGKTDYQARRALVIQDKNKYNSPKYRFVVRFTNKDIVCQVVYTKLVGDVVLCAAYAHELKNHGLNVGLTNYAAAYATGLLCARRMLKTLKLDTKYPGLEGDDYGEDYYVEPAGDDEPNPFLCFLDVGLTRTNTGNRVFAAMKGACDGGLDIPHNEKRFAGYDTESKKLDSDRLRDYILGGHVSEYMTALKDDEPEKYKKQFSKYLDAGISADGLEDMYKKVHASIRANPDAVKAKPFSGKSKKYNTDKLTFAQRRAAVEEKKKALIAAAMAEADDDSDDE